MPEQLRAAVQDFSRPTWIQVDLSAIAHNVRAVRARLPQGTGVMAVVKANAYGHGAVEVAKAALASGATRLGVAVLEEALVLRKAGIDAPILVFGYTSPSFWPIAQEQGISLTFFDESQVDLALQRVMPGRKPLRIHLKVDTGMGRIGFTEAESFLRSAGKIAAAKHLLLEGVFTHFARADEEDPRFTELQAERFGSLVQRLEAQRLRPELLHLNNSAGGIRFPGWSRSFIRLGISLYGLYPSSYIKGENWVELRPALSLKSRIVQVKEVPPGTPISYGGTYVTPSWAKIATIPIGYGDGYSRRLSNRGQVLIRGRRAPIVGRICMDQMMVDVTHVPGAAVGDEVVLIGCQGEEAISADEVAEWLGTINYEVTTCLGSRVPRIYTGVGNRCDVEVDRAAAK